MYNIFLQRYIIHIFGTRGEESIALTLPALLSTYADFGV